MTTSRPHVGRAAAVPRVNVAPLPSPSLCGEHAAAVLLDDRAHDVQAEAGALDLEAARLEAIEAIEDALELRARDADAAIATRTHTVSGRRRGHLDRDLHPRRASTSRRCRAGSRARCAVRRRRRRPADPLASAGVPTASRVSAAGDGAAAPSRALARRAPPMSTGRAVLQRAALAGDAGLQHLLDRLLQPIGVGEHDAVELAAAAPR